MPSLETALFETLSAQSYAVFGLAFAGGVVSSLLPCAVGMLPVLVGYVGGYTAPSRWAALQQILMFMLGYALVMTALGVLAATAGLAFGSLVGGVWYYMVGALAILMGLHLLEVFQLPLPQFVTRLPESKGGRLAAPLLLGLAFGAATSPCGTPFLTAILGFISQQKNLALGGAGLFAYSLGQSMILLAAGLFTGLLKHMATLRRVGYVFTRLSGAVFILAGLVIIAQAAGWLDPFAFY